MVYAPWCEAEGRKDFVIKELKVNLIIPQLALYKSYRRTVECISNTTMMWLAKSRMWGIWQDKFFSTNRWKRLKFSNQKQCADLVWILFKSNHLKMSFGRQKKNFNSLYLPLPVSHKPFIFSRPLQHMKPSLFSTVMNGKDKEIYKDEGSECRDNTMAYFILNMYPSFLILIWIWNPGLDSFSG